MKLHNKHKDNFVLKYKKEHSEGGLPVRGSYLYKYTLYGMSMRML